MGWRFFLAAIIGLLIGGIAVLGVLTHRIQNDDVTLRTGIAGIRSDMLQLRAQIAEAKASALLLGPDKQRAKVAAVEAAKAAATTTDFPVPPQAQMETKPSSQIDDETKKKELETVAAKAANAPENASDAGVPGCQGILDNIKSSVKSNNLTPLKSEESVKSLTDCKHQLDQHEEDLKNQYQAQGCDAHPDTPACKKTSEEIKQASLLDQLIKVALVAAAVYLIMDGDLATGLLLLSLANGVGNAPASSSGSPGGPAASGTPGGPAASGSPGGSAPAGQQATQLESKNPVTAGANSFKPYAPGQDIDCKFGDRPTILVCSQHGHPESGITVDPQNSPDAVSSGRSDIARWLSDGIQGNDGQTLVRWCTHENKQDHSDWLSGIILKHDNAFYPIEISTSHSKTKVVYAESHEKVQNDCSALSGTLR